jgi:predicted thioesterase
MTQTLGPGASAVLEWVVEEKHCTQRGDQLIFSTPNLVLLLEEAAIKALEPYLEAGQGSVGARVDVAHLAPTPVGMRVRATASVREIDRRRVTFEVVVEDEVERIGEASHDRFVIDIDRFEQRLAAKVARG